MPSFFWYVLVNIFWSIIYVRACSANEAKSFRFGLKLVCATNNDENMLLLRQKDVVLYCHLRFLNDGNGLARSFGNDSRSANEVSLTTTIRNSTFYKVYHWHPKYKEDNWTIAINHTDLFETFSDFKLPKNHVPAILKWKIVTKLCSPVFPSCLSDHTFLGCMESDAIHRIEWGILVHNDRKCCCEKLVFYSLAHIPCQPGSSLLIMSSSSRTMIASTWNAFKGNSTVRWYDATSLISNISENSNSGVPIIYNAAFALDRLILVSSLGIIASSRLLSHCLEAILDCKTIEFSKVPLSADLYNLKWNFVEVIYTPICSAMDEIKVSKERAFIKGETEDNVAMIFEMMNPLKTITVMDKIECDAGSRLITLEYNPFSQIMHVICMDTNKQLSALFISVVDDRNTERSLFSFVFSSEFVPYRVLLVSAMFEFLLGKSQVWYSSDGGFSYSRLFSLKENEETLSVAVHYETKTITFLLSNNKVVTARAGVHGIFKTFITHESCIAITFDNSGALYALEAEKTDLEITVHEIDTAWNGSCTWQLVPHQPYLVDSTFYLDVGEKLVLSATAYTIDAAKDDITNPRVTAVLSNPQVLQATMELAVVSPYLQRIDVTVENVNNVEGTGAITFMLRNAEASCSFTAFTITIILACPPRKQLKFDYSSFVDPENLLSVNDFVNLSYASPGLRLIKRNYHPPSAIGIAIPLSKNIYNIDPSVVEPEPLLHYKFDTKHGVPTSCEINGTNRCGCSSAMKFSSSEIYSGCREKVYEIKYDKEYEIKLSILNEVRDIREQFNGTDLLIFLEEVNGRNEDVYSILEGAARFCGNPYSHDICRQHMGDAGKSYFLNTLYFMSYGSESRIFNSTALVIKFLGTGLFHFRIAYSKGFSYCKLQDEFQVYVTNPPLPFPVGTIIRLIVFVIMALALVMIFMKSILSLNSKVVPVLMEAVDGNEKKLTTGRRINASHVNQDDVINLRRKLRSSLRNSQ